MSEQPSWKTSTLSQAFIGSLTFYCATLLLVSAGVIWANLDMEKAKVVIGWVSALQTAITSAYLTARKVGGNGGTHEEAPRPPA